MATSRHGGSRKRTKSTNKLLMLLLLAAVCLLAAGAEKLGLFHWDNAYQGAGLTAAPTVTDGSLEVHVLDVGNADCILIRSGEQNMLIDAGEKGDKKTIVTYLRAHGVSRLDLVIATHPHADHIGSMAAVIDSFEIGTFILRYMPEEATPTSAVYEDMLLALDEKKISPAEAQPGAQYTLGQAQITLLAPLTDSAEENDMSVVCRLTYGGRRFLFMGDASAAVERQLLSSGCDLTADVLKVGHHGSAYSSSAMFIQAVAPQYAVLTCGAGNSYGHPAQQTLDTLTGQKAVTVLRGDVNGTMVFTTDGTGLSVETEK